MKDHVNNKFDTELLYYRQKGYCDGFSRNLNENERIHLCQVHTA